MTLTVSFTDAIDAVRREDWQRLVACDNPFISFDYLHALELTGATGEGTGWIPHHALVHDGDTLVAALPLYLKDNSWGEFVFDFAWAEAHQRHGIPYYPKLVTAVPYTPVAGPRLLTSSAVEPAAVMQLLQTSIQTVLEEHNGSSWHLLFPTASQLPTYRDVSEYIVREDCQFHWHNQNYTSFDDYLSYFRSSRRKKTRRERRKISEAEVDVTMLAGNELTTEQWETFYELYASTFYVRGRAPYFQLEFFTTLAASEQINMRVCFGTRNEDTLAASLFFVTDTTLYGRYWGAKAFVDGLHFELCYYQGIEYCIEHGIKVFDPGVQGEHKIARGFQASRSYSVHWLRYPPFADAIRRHVGGEASYVDEYAEQVDQHLPFRRDDPTTP